MIPTPLVFRDTDEINLWVSWTNGYCGRLGPEETAAAADALLIIWRERMRGVILQAKPGRA